jgi:hypothetical protein
MVIMNPVEGAIVAIPKVPVVIGATSLARRTPSATPFGQNTW